LKFQALVFVALEIEAALEFGDCEGRADAGTEWTTVTWRQ
jgi:hypothetical protein